MSDPGDEMWDHDDYPDPFECDHDDYDADVLTGRAMCNRCGNAWWQTKEQIEAEIRHQAEYQEWVAEQERPWTRFKQWLGVMKPRFRRKRAPLLDGEIPF